MSHRRLTDRRGADLAGAMAMEAAGGVALPLDDLGRIRTVNDKHLWRKLLDKRIKEARRGIRVRDLPPADPTFVAPEDMNMRYLLARIICFFIGHDPRIHVFGVYATCLRCKVLLRVGPRHGR